MASKWFLPNLSQRERNIALLTVGFIALVVVYLYAIQPFVDYRAELIGSRAHAADELRQARNLVARVPRMMTQWRAYDLQTEGSEASQQLQHAIEDWQQKAGIDLTLQKPDRPIPDPKDDRFMQVTFQVQGIGSTAEISRFIYLVEKSELPARIVRIHVGAHGKEGVDDLTMEMTISSIFLAPPKPAKHGGAVALAGNSGDWKQRSGQ